MVVLQGRGEEALESAKRVAAAGWLDPEWQGRWMVRQRALWKQIWAMNGKRARGTPALPAVSSASRVRSDEVGRMDRSGEMGREHARMGRKAGEALCWFPLGVE